MWLDHLIKEVVGAKTTLSLIQTGIAAPSFELEAIEGETIGLPNHQGNVVLLDFWQWWCPPCVQALPHIQALQTKYADSGLVVLGVSDRLDLSARKRTTATMAEYGATFPTLIDSNGSVARSYGVNQYPTLVLIDRSGVVRWTTSGMQPDDEADLETQIKRLLEDQ